MSLEIKPGTKVLLHLKSHTGPIRHSGTIVHVSAVSIVLELDQFNSDKNGRVIGGNYNYLFTDIVEIYQR